MALLHRLVATATTFGFAAALGTGATPGAGVSSGTAVSGHHVIALLPLSPIDTGLPYAPLPLASNLDAMSKTLRLSFAATKNSMLVPKAKVARALRTAGYDQYSPLKACTTPECAQKIGKIVGADRVVMGGVTREMAVVWSTDLSVVDVKTGRVLTALRAGYKGDVQSMIQGEAVAGTCIVRVLNNKQPCKNDPGF